MGLLHIWSKSFENWCFCTGSQSDEFVNEFFKSRFFVSYSSIVFLCNLHWFSKPNVLGVHQPCAGSKAWGTWCETQTPHSSRKRSVPLRYSLSVNLRAWGGGPPLEWYLCLSYQHQCCLFIPCHRGSVHPVPRSFSEEFISCVVADSLYPWEKVSTGSSYATILNLSGQEVFKDSSLHQLLTVVAK